MKKMRKITALLTVFVLFVALLGGFAQADTFEGVVVLPQSAFTLKKSGGYTCWNMKINDFMKASNSFLPEKERVAKAKKNKDFYVDFTNRMQIAYYVTASGNVRGVSIFLKDVDGVDEGSFIWGLASVLSVFNYGDDDETAKDIKVMYEAMRDAYADNDVTTYKIAASGVKFTIQLLDDDDDVCVIKAVPIKMG